MSRQVVVRHDRRSAGVVLIGAFRYVRHRFCLASLLAYFGLAVSTASLFSRALLIAIFLFHNDIANYEEKLLEERVGEDHRAII